MIVSSKFHSQEVFKCLKGNWILQRFKDLKPLATANASFCLLKNTPNALAYREEGCMIHPAPEPFTFYREYEYHLEHNRINVFFVNQNEENKLFHTLDFSIDPDGFMVASAVHNCALDVYEINYTLSCPDKLAITYRVTGPNKNYILTTNFNRK